MRVHLASAVIALVTAIFVSSGCSCRDGFPTDGPGGPVSANATAETVALLGKLQGLRRSGILTGVSNHPPEPDEFGPYVDSVAGDRPAIWGNDFKYGPRAWYRPQMIEEAIHQWQRGSVITLMYHATRPMDPIDAGFDSVGGEISVDELDSLLTPGTELNSKWLEHIDAVAVGLKELRDAGVPVLWRPYHEMNGAWFWWGQKPGGGYRSIWRKIYPHIPHLIDPLTDVLRWFRQASGPEASLDSGLIRESGWNRQSQFEGNGGFPAVWRMMFDRYTNYHGLNNLIWVWSVSPPSDLVDPLEPYWPGSAYVDIVGLDLWSRTLDSKAYEAVRSIAQGKPIMITEIGHLPAPDSLIMLQPEWSAVVVYSGYIKEVPVDRLREFYDHPSVLSLDDWTAIARPGVAADVSENPLVEQR